jgi:hypothetical protein
VSGWEEWWTSPAERADCVMCGEATDEYGDLYGRCETCVQGIEVRKGLSDERYQKRSPLDSRACVVCGKRGYRACAGVCTRAWALCRLWSSIEDHEACNQPTRAADLRLTLRRDMDAIERQEQVFRDRSDARRG